MAINLVILLFMLFNINVVFAAYERQYPPGGQQISGILCSLADFGFSTHSNPGRAITLLLITKNASSISMVNFNIPKMHWGNDFPPLNVEPALNSKLFTGQGSGIISITPADFDSDGLVDLLVVQPSTSNNSIQTYTAYIFWRNSSDSSVILDDSFSYLQLPMNFNDQPFLFDLDANLKPELLVRSPDNSRQVLYFNQRSPTPLSMPLKWVNGSTFNPLPFPPQTSHAYYSFGPANQTSNEDSDNTFNADLLITSIRQKPNSIYTFEHWRRQTHNGGYKALPSGQGTDYVMLESIVELSYPDIQTDAIVGPSVLLDMAASGYMNHIVPVCYNSSCASGAILVYNGSAWQNVFSLPWTDSGKTWRFPTPTEQSALLSPAWANAGFNTSSAIASPALAAGDADLNGKPDLLTVLVNANDRLERRVLLLSNAGGTGFQPYTTALAPRDGSPGLQSPMQGALSATFYDVSDDGHLDILLTIVNTSTGEPELQFYQQFATTSYFIKVTVLGCTNDLDSCSTSATPSPYGLKAYGAYARLSTKPLTYSQLLSGEAQQPQNSHLQVSSPYSLFGLTEATNAVDNLYITVPYTDTNHPRTKTLSALFPNTQLVVLCVLDKNAPTGGCSSWDVRLYLARSFWMEGRFIAVLAVILATLLINFVLIALLQWREMKEDRKDRMAENPYINPS